MARLDRHLAARMTPWLAASLAIAALGFVASQAVRVAPAFAGASGAHADLAEAFALLLVPVAGWALTPAFATAVFALAHGLHTSGELTALDAAGIPRWRVAVGPTALACALFAVSAWIWMDASWRSHLRLHALVTDLAGRALVGRLAKGRFIEPADGITFYADSRDGAAFEGVLLEDARDPSSTIQIVAARAEVAFDPGGSILTLRFWKGNVFAEGFAPDEPAALGFESLSLAVPLGEEIIGRTGFLPRSMSVSTSRLLGPPRRDIPLARWEYALWRRIAGPLGFLAMATASIVLALISDGRRRWVAPAAGAVVFLALHVLSRGAESAAEAGLIGGAAAAVGPPLIVLAAAAGGLVKAVARPHPISRRAD